MRIVRGAYFWQFGSIASLPTETTDGEIRVAFLAQTWPQKRSQSAKKFSRGGHAPRSPGGLPTRSNSFSWLSPSCDLDHLYFC